jgi:hypothetical protein
MASVSVAPGNRPELVEPGLTELELKHHLVKPDLTGSLEAGRRS